MEEARCFSLLATVEQAVEADGACAPPLNGIAFDGRSPLGIAWPVVGRLLSTVRWSGETRTPRIVEARCFCLLAAVEPAVAADDPAAGISGVTSTDRSCGGLAA